MIVGRAKRARRTSNPARSNLGPYKATSSRLLSTRPQAATGRAQDRPPVAVAKAPVQPQPAQRESRKILIATIIVSAAVHAAAIASVMSGDAGEQFGMLSSKIRYVQSLHDPIDRS